MKKKSINKLRSLFYELISAFRTNKALPQSNDPEGKLLIDSFALLRDKKYQDALALIEQQNEPEFLTLQGIISFQKKDYLRSEKSFKKAIEIDDSFAYPYYGLGNIYKDLKKHHEAEEAYKLSIQKDGKDFSPYIGLGNIYKEIKKYEEAEQAYRASIELNENSASPYIGLGNLYFDLQRYDEAEKAYNAAINKDEDHAYPYNGLGNLYFELKRYKEAEKAYNVAISKDSNLAAPYNGLGNLYSAINRYNEAEKAFNTAISKDQNLAIPYSGLGGLYYDLKRYDEAEKAYNTAISKDQNFASPYNGLGNLYSATNRYDEAEKAYNVAISKDQNFMAPYNGLGNLYYATNRYDEAEKAYNTAISKDQNLAIPYTGLGNLYYNLKKYDDAEKAYKTAIEKDQKYAYANSNLGILYTHLKRYEEAELNYKLAISKDPNNIILFRNLALLYNEINKKPDPEFIDQYNQLVQITPSIRDEYTLGLISGKNSEAQKEVDDKRKIEKKLDETIQVTTSGFVIFIDLCNSTEFKTKFKEEWFERLIHFYKATEKHLMDKLAAFTKQVHLLKYIGDEVMFFIEEKANGDHCKDFHLLQALIDFIETIREHLNRIYFLEIKPSNSEESSTSKMMAYEFEPDKIDIKTCVTYVNEVNKYTFNQEKSFDILGSPVDFSARLMGLCKENMVICNHDFANMFEKTNHQKKFKNIGVFTMKGIDENYSGNREVYIFDHNNLSSLIDQSYLNKHSTINDQIIGRFLLSDSIKNQ